MKLKFIIMIFSLLKLTGISASEIPVIVIEDFTLPNPGKTPDISIDDLNAAITQFLVLKNQDSPLRTFLSQKFSKEHADSDKENSPKNKKRSAHSSPMKSKKRKLNENFDS